MSNLSGRWVSHDYECPWGVRNTEVVRIVHEGERVVATKVTGDDCVPAGFVTFAGTLPNGQQLGAITWTTGQPEAPASDRLAGYLKVLDNAAFEAGAPGWPKQRFVREEPQRPHD